MQRGTRDEGLTSVEWRTTPLGPSEEWPQSLRTAFSLCSRLPEPACLVWGTGRLQLFNERYRALWAPERAPGAGQDFAASWNEDWPKVSPSFERALAGEPARLDTFPGLLQSARLRQDTVTLSFMPVPAEHGMTGGVLVLVKGAQSPQVDGARRDFELIDYVISHDFLAPARTMQEMARILGEERADELPPDIATFLGHFTRATAALNARIEGLIRFRKISSQPLACRRVDITTLVQELVTAQRSSTQGERVTVSVSDLPEANGDRELLRQAFGAVIANAFKFVRQTPAPRVEIGAHRETGGNVFFIADNGVGFDMKYADRLFGLFQRLHSDPQLQGTGVELAVARRIVERHGGTMRAEAQKGVGATFEISLPRVADGAAG